MDNTDSRLKTRSIVRIPEAAIPVDRIVKIDPNSKYVLVFPETLDKAEFERYSESAKHFWEDENMRLFCVCGVDLFALEKDGEETDHETQEGKDA